MTPWPAGLFWGAPLIARETERGTHRLAWTQSVSRGRRLAVKLTAFVAATVLAAAVVPLLLAWWLRPYEQLIDQLRCPVHGACRPGLDPLSSRYTAGRVSSSRTRSRPIASSSVGSRGPVSLPTSSR